MSEAFTATDEVRISMTPGHLTTLRSAVFTELETWTDAAKRELAEVREADMRGSTDKAKMARADFVSAYSAASDAAALLPQVPEHDNVDEVTVVGPRRAVVGLVEEAARLCGDQLRQELDCGPLPTKNARVWHRELEWWMDAYESLADYGDVEVAYPNVAL